MRTVRIEPLIGQGFGDPAAFGFLLWERDAAERTAWSGKLIGQAGNDLVSCRLRDRVLACEIER